MKAVKVECIKEYEGLHVGDEVTAIYAPTAKGMRYHIASKPLTDKVFDKHFKIVGIQE